MNLIEDSLAVLENSLISLIIYEELLAWQSFKLFLTDCTVCYKLSMSIMFTIIDVFIQ